MSLAGNGISMPGPFGASARTFPGVIPNWGGGVSNMWAAANDMYAHNDELTFSNKVTKIAGAHGLKFGASVSRLQKQQNFHNNEEMELVFAGPGWTPGSTGNAVGDILTGRITQMANAGSRRRTASSGFWNFDFFAQDSWKVKPNFTLEFGVRAGYWTNNAELERARRLLRSRALRPEPGRVPRPRHVTSSLNGYCYVGERLRARRHARQPQPVRDAARQRRVGHRRPGQQRAPRRLRHVLQPQHGQRRVRQRPALAARRPTSINADVFNASDPDGTGRGLTYDTLDNIRLADRLGSVGVIIADAGLVHVPEDAQLQRVVSRGASRSARCSRRPTSARAAATW